jgi:hypothetical protein
LDVVRIQVEKRGSKEGEKECVLCCRRRDSDSSVVELLCRRDDDPFDQAARNKVALTKDASPRMDCLRHVISNSSLVPTIIE